MMNISDKGVALIKEFEGCKLAAYKCPAGVWTIGIGTTKGVKAGMVITEGQAVEFLRRDLNHFETAVDKLLDVKVSQPMFDALVSFVYNLGEGALAKSTLLKKLNAGDFKSAGDEFLKWNKAAGRVLEGLTRRRKAERALFLSGL